MDDMENMEHVDAVAEQQETPPAKTAPLWEDFIDVFVSPAALFDRRRNGRGSRWVVPLIVLAVLALVLYYVFLPATEAITRAAMQAQMAKNPQVNAATMEKGARMMRIFGGIIVPFAIAIRALLLGLLLWLFTKLVDSALTFAQSMVIVVYASFVSILQQVAVGILVIVKNNNGAPIDAIRDTAIGPARFVPTGASPALLAILGRFDLFVLWQLVLWIVGVKVITRTSTGRAVLAAVLVWAVAIVPALVQAVMQGGRAGA